MTMSAECNRRGFKVNAAANLTPRECVAIHCHLLQRQVFLQQYEHLQQECMTLFDKPSQMSCMRLQSCCNFISGGHLSQATIKSRPQAIWPQHACCGPGSYCIPLLIRNHTQSFSEGRLLDHLHGLQSACSSPSSWQGLHCHAPSVHQGGLSLPAGVNVILFRSFRKD